MKDCYGCVREFSTNISEQLEFCNYCNRNDNQEFHEDKYELYMACNLKTCRHNKDGKCTSEEDRKICVDVAKKVLCVGESGEDKSEV